MGYARMLNLFHIVGELKNIKRAGWLRYGINEAETVAEHTFRTAFMAMVIGDILNVDTLKMVRMALLHDIAEALMGDITPYDGLTDTEKMKKEEKAVNEILNGLPNSEKYLAVWKEFVAGKSREAKLVRDIDKLERAIQAAEYEEKYSKDLGEFMNVRMKARELREIFAEIEKC